MSGFDPITWGLGYGFSLRTDGRSIDGFSMEAGGRSISSFGIYSSENRLKAK